MNLTPEQVAEVCHEANRVLQRQLGEPVAREWSDFSKGEREGVVSGVKLAVTGATPEEMHHNWVLEKLEAGWRQGPELDREAKVHPNLVPYGELEESQRVKDSLFLGIVGALTG